MDFTWKDYLSIAEKISQKTKGKSNNHALKRTAITRAYFSVHNIAVNYAKNNFGYKYDGKKTGANSHHADICTEYKSKTGNYKYQEVGQKLASISRTRKKCDYEENINDLGNLDNLLENTIIDANTIVNNLSEIR